MKDIKSIHHINLMRRGIRTAALLDADIADLLPERIQDDDRAAFNFGFEVFNDACQTATGSVSAIFDDENVDDWDAAMWGALAAVDTPSLALPLEMEIRAVIAYTIANGCVLHALSQAALRVAAGAAWHDGATRLTAR